MSASLIEGHGKRRLHGVVSCGDVASNLFWYRIGRYGLRNKHKIPMLYAVRSAVTATAAALLVTRNHLYLLFLLISQLSN